MPARQMTVCFSGYRPEKLPWGYDECDPRCAQLKQRLRRAVCAACDDGFRHFICGMAQGCDLYFCELALQLRGERPDMTIEAAIPCRTQADSWSAEERRRWRGLIGACDEQTLLQENYSPHCMQRRNRYMVDHASLLIAVNDGARGGTRSTIEYAFKRGVNVLDIPLD